MIHLVNLAGLLLGNFVLFVTLSHPDRKGRRVPRRFPRLYFLIGVPCALLCLWGIARMGQTLRAYNLMNTLLLLGCCWIPFYLYPGRFYQSLFLLMMSGMSFLVVLGLGNFAEARLAGLPALPARALNLAVALLVAAVLLPTSSRLLRRLFQSWQGDATTSAWRPFWMVPAAFIALCFASGNYLYPESVVRLNFALSRLVVGISLYILLYYMTAVLRQGAAAATLAERGRMMELQLALQREQYARLTAQMERDRAARHDLRHQLTVLHGFAQAGDAEGLAQYLDAYLDTLEAPPGDPYCANFALNALLQHYAGIAGEAAIRTDFRLSLPDVIAPSLEDDLCVVLGNCLENAIEACRELPEIQRWLALEARMDGEAFTLTAENSYAGEVRVSQGSFLSRKHTGEGIGIPSLRTIAMKRAGEVAFQYGGSRFRVEMTLGVDGNPDEKNPRGA